MTRASVPCPQCDSKIELDQPRSRTDASGSILEPNVLAHQCERCAAWIRIEGWSDWSATHYSMTAFTDARSALEAFPDGTWFAVADVAEPN